MARTKKVPFAPWESRAPDGVEKRYFRIGVTLTSSEAMRNLPPSAFKVLIYMKMESAGKKQFEFPYAKYRSFMTKPTFSKALKDLVSHGFVDVVQNNRNLRKPNVYAFSERWKGYAEPKIKP